MKRICRVIFLLATAAMIGAAPSEAETVGTLALDGLSFVSFQDRQIVPLAGGLIRFHFGESAADGSISFTIGPSDVSMPEIPLPGGETIHYGLASATSGRLLPSTNGLILQFSATVTATLLGGESDGSLTYSVPFSTESVSAGSGANSVEVSGVRIVPGARYTQLVGATVNKSDEMSARGVPVYTVLSGTFDQLP